MSTGARFEKEAKVNSEMAYYSMILHHRQLHYCIHIYTNLPETEVKLHILETYFSDHKAVCALNCFQT